MKTTSSKSLLIATAIIIPLISVAGLMIAAGSGQVAAPPITAKVHRVAVIKLAPQQSYQQQQMAYGRIESANIANLGFELAGKVEQLLVDEGDFIQAGQLIARLDTQRIDASMKELDAALQRAKSDARLAKQSQQRVAELVAKKLESSQRLDEVNESYQRSSAQVAETQARINTLQVELSKSQLLASFDGTVVSRPVDPGTVISAGQPVFQVQQASQYDARIALSSDRAFALKIGQSHDLLVNAEQVSGVVKSIASTRQLNTRTIDVIFSLGDILDSRLLPGDLVGLTYSKQVSEYGAWVPKEALSSGIRGLWTLFTVPGKGQQSVTSRSVEVLYSGQTHSFVRGALSADDWMVVSGAHRLVPGQVVEAVESATNAQVMSLMASNQGMR
ncbi:efflux RND transporter periplasmic adaptor subunit [Aliiglaciecola sp. LCG003]|uniref:efflux RND transporter periplasmic adaptor subunit n=1 Tax=Aliiglaciecola sp. LCG003 TaxID=3053655 RepID=UPI0025733C5F|nr:efflux RND transporter periplasmic adaptor subunit [Aliiglaciecola sp. LCG003]WJG09990.1 efflux RND transporter periplasmic adaptor subunit [Aliiglaciecola sp. LCG003]